MNFLATQVWEPAAFAHALCTQTIRKMCDFPYQTAGLVRKSSSFLPSSWFSKESLFSLLDGWFNMEILIFLTRWLVWSRNLDFPYQTSGLIRIILHFLAKRLVWWEKSWISWPGVWFAKEIWFSLPDNWFGLGISIFLTRRQVWWGNSDFPCQSAGLVRKPQFPLADTWFGKEIAIFLTRGQVC